MPALDPDGEMIAVVTPINGPENPAKGDDHAGIAEFERGRSASAPKRVSSEPGEQVEALKSAGCEWIFNEKASGKSTDGRPEFAKLRKVLLTGDTVVVTKLDRLFAPISF